MHISSDTILATDVCKCFVFVFFPSSSNGPVPAFILNMLPGSKKYTFKHDMWSHFSWLDQSHSQPVYHLNALSSSISLQDKG